MRRIYLDFNATAPLSAVAREAMVAALDVLGNPSSIHAEGRAARHLVEVARDQVAALAGVGREQVVFTSGGTEANRLGIELLADGRTGIGVTTALEHPSVRGVIAALGGRELGMVRLDEPVIDLEPLAVGEVFAVAAVNHELGTLGSSTAGDLAGTIAAVRARGGRVHLDAVQAAGRCPLAALVALADTVAISAHKLGGPAGVGALILQDADRVPRLELGHQERGRRAGTENVVGIAGFGAAAAHADPGTWTAVAALGDRLEQGLLALDGVRIHGGRVPRVGGTINAGFSGARGHALVIALDLAGIAASTGAACASGSVAPSPVIVALGHRPDRAVEAVRFSLGRSTTTDEIDAVLATLPAVLQRARAHR